MNHNPICPKCGHQVPVDADSAWFAGYQYARGHYTMVVVLPPWWRTAG